MDLFNFASQHFLMSILKGKTGVLHDLTWVSQDSWICVYSLSTEVWFITPTCLLLIVKWKAVLTQQDFSHLVSLYSCLQNAVINIYLIMNGVFYGPSRIIIFVLYTLALNQHHTIKCSLFLKWIFFKTVVLLMKLA